MPREDAITPDGATVGVDTTVPLSGGSGGDRPTQLGRYVVTGTLGSGGMGDVYEAHDPDLDRKVAIKLLHARSSSLRLVREARALARLAHPNVVAVHDVGTFEGRSFVAMELVDGTTLRAWMDERPRPWREVLDMFSHAGQGLAAAHAAGLVHRDFKPENVMIGRDGRVRVLDFGIVGSAPTDGEEVAFAAAGADPDRMTVEGGIMGTPAYMAPEQFRSEEVDARADQFGFCVALWEALHAARPFAGDNLRALTHWVLTGTIEEPPPGRAAPSWLRRLLVRGLSVDKEARYPSMDALLADAAKGTEAEDASARLVGRRYDPIRPSLAGSTGGERALDRLTGRVVTLSRVGLRHDDREPDSTHARLELTRVFRDLSSLRHPNLVGVLDFGFDQDRLPYFVLDQRDASDDLLLSAQRQATLPLDALVQILRALAYLHRRRMALGSLAPDDLFFSGGRVQLVPLGTAIDANRARPAYIAPELAKGGSPTAAADLYAAGVLGFELFMGRHPFGGAPRGSRDPDPAALELEPKIAAVLWRMLERDPGARPARAEEVIEALAAAAGRPLAADTVETRESFLQAAPLVGRDREVALLHEALRGAVAGRGSAWLVGGESGVGKSRLLEELRALALVEGAIVLRGQEESEGGSPYRLFRDVLRRLALCSDFDDFEAGVLLPIVPDVGDLLDRPVAPVQELDAPAMHARLRQVVKRILRRQILPMVLLLEDLQWSRSDSLKLLQAICPLVSASPLLVVATYRDDERPGLCDELPGMRPLDLERLPERAVGELAAAMMGEAGRRPEIVARLSRETEGNAFFVVEIVRALAEEAGGLDRIGTAPLPDMVFAGGVRRVVQRRLRRLPEEDRALLRTAAVIGRTIDPALILALSPGVDLDAWLSRCVEAAVLERVGERLRFSHDKLREGLLAELVGEERGRLHKAVADATVLAYPDAPARYAVLAHHFAEAGDLVNEARYAARAGVEARTNGAFVEAIHLLERAHAILAERPAEPVARAGLLTELAVARSGSGDPAGALRDLSRAIQVVGYSPPGRGVGLVVMLVWQIALQVASWLSPRLVRIEDERRLRATRVAARAAEQLLDGYILTLDSNARVVAASLLAASCAERVGSRQPKALTMLALVAGTAGLHRVARGYLARAGADAPGSPASIAWVEARNYEGLYWIGAASYARAYDLCAETSRGAVEIGFGLGANIAEGLQAMSAFYQGRLAETLDLFLSSLRHVKSQESEYELAAVCQCAFALSALGRHDEALETLLSRPRARRDVELYRALELGVEAFVHARRGDDDNAWQAANEALRDAVTIVRIPSCLPQVLWGPACAYVARWERMTEPRSPAAREVERAARRHLRLMRVWARMHRAGEPQALLFAGQVARLRGRPAEAGEALRQALALAQALGMPYHEGLAHLELARLADEDRDAHLGHAEALFEAAAAGHELRQIEAQRGPRRLRAAG